MNGEKDDEKLVFEAICDKSAVLKEDYDIKKGNGTTEDNNKPKSSSRKLESVSMDGEESKSSSLLQISNIVSVFLSVACIVASLMIKSTLLQMFPK